MKQFFVYIIKCCDNYLYTGLTGNIGKRLNQHKKGFNKNTRNRLPIQLVYLETFSTKEDAAKREKEIKGWKREKKEKLIQNYEMVYTERSEVRE